MQLTGTYLKLDGLPCSGSVVFTLSTTLQDEAGNVIFPPISTVAQLNINGSFSVSLPATNDPTSVPSGVTYAVTEQISSTNLPPRAYNIVLDHTLGLTQDLADLAPTSGTAFFQYVLVSTFTAAMGNLSGVTDPVTARVNLGVNAAADLASTTNTAKGSALLGWLSTLTGAVGRTLASKLGDVISVKDFGAKGDGSTDDTAAIAAAMTAVTSAKGTVFFPAGSYLVGSALTVPANISLVGSNRYAVTLLHGFNGDFIDLGSQAELRHLTIEGQGATFTGKGISLSGTNGAQRVSDCNVVNFSSACIYFAVGAGSRSTFTQIAAFQVSGASGSGNYAVVVDPTQQLSAKPRSFVQLDTSGNCGIDFGGCNDIYVTTSTFADLNFTADSRGYHISASRWLNQSACTINGHNGTITGCDISPALTIAASADALAIGHNSYNQLPITDSSGNSRNQITHADITYVPSLTSGGTAPSLGNGTLTGRYARHGAAVTATINLTLGSTTTLGSGELRFSLPVARVNGTIETCGGAVMLNGSTNYTGQVQIPGAVSYCRIIRDTSGSVTFNSPVTWASGDTMRITITYTL